MSGPLSKKFIGTDERNVVPFLLVITFLATASASPLPFITGFWEIMSSLWGYLFFGGILVPVMTTYMLNSIDDEDERAIGNSFANVIYYALGYLPSPFMWGFVQGITGGKHSKWGLIANLGMNIPPIIMLIIAFKFRPAKSKIVSDSENVDAAEVDHDEPAFLSKNVSLQETLIKNRSGATSRKSVYFGNNRQTVNYGYFGTLTGRSFVDIKRDKKPDTARDEVKVAFLNMVEKFDDIEDFENLAHLPLVISEYPDDT